MIHRINKGLIMFVIIVLILNLSIPLTISKTATINPKDEYKNYTDISFDKSYRTDYSESMYDLKNETMMNHSFFNSIDNNESNSFDNITGESISNRTVIVYSDDDALMDSCWPMKSQNRRHSGLSPYNTPDSKGSVNWTKKISDWIESGIVIDDEGVLYFGDFDYNLCAVYPDGTLKWKFKTNGWIWSTPALASDGTVYVGSFGDYLYAINPNGTLKWRFWAGSAASLSSSPAISKEGIIYFGAMGPNTEQGGEHGRIYALYPNGTEKWHYDTGYWICSDPAIADDGTIYIGSGDSYLYALDPDGSLKWRFKTGDIVKSHPAIAEDGTIYFDSFDDYLYALSPDGTVQWKYHDVGDGSGGAAIDENGIIYIGGRRLSAFYPDGSLKWHYSFGKDNHSGHSSPAISADGIIYIGVSNEDNWAGYIYAINNDGSLKWMRKIANYECTSSPAIAEDGTVYIGSSSKDPSDDYGVLYAFCSGDLNNKPNKPSIDGTTYGKLGESYTYVFNGSDPDNDRIYYQVNWGDGSNSGWLGPYESGESIELSHAWTFQPTSYSLDAKIKDEHGVESDTASLRVYMPKNRLNHGFWIVLDWFYELFPKLDNFLNSSYFI